jgi:hypothetical protein
MEKKILDDENAKSQALKDIECSEECDFVWDKIFLTDRDILEFLEEINEPEDYDESY